MGRSPRHRARHRPPNAHVPRYLHCPVQRGRPLVNSHQVRCSTLLQEVRSLWKCRQGVRCRAPLRPSPGKYCPAHGSCRKRQVAYLWLYASPFRCSGDTGGQWFGRVHPIRRFEVVFPHPIDKRRFLQALGSAREVLAGKEPMPSPGPQCRSCPSHPSCFPMGKRLSDIL